MTKIEKNIIDYFKDKKGVIAVYLFGSFSVGMEKPFSDIDIGILLNHQPAKNAIPKQMAYIAELGRILRKDIHPVILNTASEELLKQIFNKGKCLLINNEKKHTIFKMISISKIMDFSYLHRQMQSGFVKHLMGV